MCGAPSDDQASLYRLRSLWREAAKYPVHQATDAMRHTMKMLCENIGAVDATWLVFRKGLLVSHTMSSSHVELIRVLLNGWTPAGAIYLNPQKTLKRVMERWFMHVRKTGLDPYSENLLPQMGRSRVLIRHDFFSDEEWQEHWFSQKFLAYYGIGERMIGMSPLTDDCECCILLDRAVGEAPFSSADREKLSLALAGLGRLNERLCLERGALVASSLFSKREQQTYRLLLKNLSEAEIAEELGLSAHTIHDYARNLYKKFGVKGRVGLMAKVLESV